MAPKQKSPKKVHPSTPVRNTKAGDNNPAGQDHVARWLEAAAAVDKNALRTPGVPIAVYLQEAAGVAHFIEHYWEPPADGTRPALQTVAEILPRETGAEIRSLIEACRSLHSRVLFRGDATGTSRAELERALVVASELSSALEFVLDDGTSDSGDEALRAAKERLAEGGSKAQLAQTLADYGTIAEQVRDRLAMLGDFDMKLLEEARVLATALTARGSPTTGPAPSDDIALRDRMLHLLDERVGAVRRAARYVFRSHDEIAKRVTSAYERRRRTAYKRRAKDVSEAPNPVATSTSAATSASTSASSPESGA